MVSKKGKKTPETWRNRIVGHATVDARTLVANDKNWRTHPPAQRAAMSELIGRVGWVSSVIVNKRTNRIVDGHLRVELASEKGEQLPVGYVDLSEEEENLILTTFDPITALAMSDDARLQELLKTLDADGKGLQQLLERLNKNLHTATKEEPDIDDQAAAHYHKKWGTKEGQLWECGAHKILIGDCSVKQNYKRLMGNELASMIYTDPPYGVDYDSRSGKFAKIKNDALKGDDLVKFLAKCFQPMSHAAADRAGFYIWHASSTRREFADAMRAVGLIEHQTLIWIKPAAVLGWGDYRWQHEPCLYAAKDGQEAKFYGDRTNSTVWRCEHKVKNGIAAVVGQGLMITDGDGKSLVITGTAPKNKKLRSIRLTKNQIAYLVVDINDSDAWEVRKDRLPEHPTEKPVELGRRAIGNSSQIGEIVLDIFSGSGRIMVAAEQTGRIARCMELEPKNAAITLESMEQMGIHPQCYESAKSVR